MPKVRLNEKSIRKAPPPSGQVELWDDITPGFGLRIAAGGARTYFVMKRVDGKLIRRTIGKAPAPEVPNGAPLPQGLYWPAEARSLARGRLADMAAGRDPGIVKGAKMAPTEPAQDPNSFKAVAEAYLADKLKGGGFNLASRPELERKLKVDLAAWHDRPIAEIRRRDINELIRTKAQESPIAANRLLSFVKRVFRWAVEVDKLDADPAAAVPKPAEEEGRSRYLEPDEIRLLWRACDKLRDPAGRLFKLALVTAQRRGEIAGLRRSELGTLEYKATEPKSGRQAVRKGDAWLLSAARTKRRVEHTVPLSPLALQLIEGAPELYMPSEAGREAKLYDHVLASGARGDQPISGWSRFKKRLDELIGREIATDAEEEYDPAKHALAEWNIHDLRATALTLMEKELEVSRPVTSRIANHAEGDGRSMTARYVRHTWDGEAAEALNAWADYLSRVVGLTQSATQRTDPA
jgi:integrase